MSSEPIFQFVNPLDLVEHPEAHRIPEMSAEEWSDFSGSVRSRGEITDPVFALRNGKVFDGRHRLRASKEFGIRLIPVLFYDISEDEALQRMSDAAVLRRSLTPGQRAAIVLEFTEVVAKLRAAAKERSGIRTDLFPDLEKGKPQHTHVELAEKAGIGKSSMAMLQAVQRDEPELFAQVKSGEITVNKAYTEAKKRKEAASIGAVSDKPSDTSVKIEKLRKRKKPEAIAPNPDESALSPNNLLISFTQGKLTPFIEDFLLNYGSVKCADAETRGPFIEEVRVLFEASFRILAEFGGEKLIETMEEIQDEKTNQ